jgi:ubiquitin C-terminal hydrolase
MSIYKGLNNIGNTCYLNSGLQMLIQNSTFCTTVLENKDKSDNLKILAKFIEEYKTSSKKAITPDAIKKMVEKKRKIFKGNGQQDSTEFIITLFEIISDDIKEIDKLFEVETKTIIKCKLIGCLKESHTLEKNNCLIIPIPEEATDLDDCYRSFKVHELLDGADMYYCSNCKDKRIASKKILIESWPNDLIIGLKRFQTKNEKQSKINKDINIPFEWRHDYTIKGAIIHSGNINGGHYVYISRNIEENNWIMCDDSSTSTLNDRQAQNYLNKAYMLYYVKK